ncbi:MAG TPA: spore germination protein GerW family protein [Solirubrobacteraceae bacterium]|nr:spore germination protein GerW family protein [Solirubrobacteraceae bacterium]
MGPRRGDELLSMLAERIGARLGTATVFGAPVERDGVTVVPVAVARFGIGAGSGTDPAKGQEGEGGGGGGIVAPTGYIELKDGRSRFVPVIHPARMLAIVLGAVAGLFLLTRATQAQPRTRRLPWR